MRSALVLPLVVLVVSLNNPPGAHPFYRSADPDSPVPTTDRPAVAPENPSGGAPGPPVAPRGPVSTSDAIIDELLARSGLKRHLALLGFQLQQQLRQNGALTPDERVAVGRVAADAYRLDTLYSAVREQFSQRADDAKLNAMLVWYRSPLGMKLVELEVSAAVAQGSSEIAEYAKRLRDDPPTRERLTMLQRLDSAAGNTDLSMEVLVVIQESVVRAIDPLLPPERRMKPGQLQSHLGYMRTEMATPMREAVLLTMLVTYQSVSDDELTEYLQLMESPAGRWFSEASRKALLRSIAGAAESTANEVARVVPSEVWQRGEFKKPPLPY